MDPKDKIIADLKASVEKLTGELKTVGESNKKLGEDLKAKDVVIEQKNRDIVGARKEYKKLSEMTEDEKKSLSDKEIELQTRAEKIEADALAFQKKQDELYAKEKTSRVESIVKKIAGSNKEIAEKVRANMSRIKEFETATTEEEISKIAEEGFNMIGSARPNPVRQAVNANGGEAGEFTPGSFAESPEGKSLAGALNLPVAKPTEGGAK